MSADEFDRVAADDGMETREQGERAVKPSRFRKRPVVIEAIRYMPGETCDQISEWLGDEHHPDDCFEGAEYAIETLEGVMWAQPGDWIIKGVMGEFYPCKPDIFAATYEAVDP